MNDGVQEVEMLLRTISSKINKETKDNLSKFNLNKSRFFVLIIVSKYENITMGELKKEMHLACSSITNLVDKLEDDNLLKRSRSKEDRRVINLHLTEKGEELLESIMTFRCQYINQAIKKLDVTETLQLKDTLKKINQLLGESSC
ncbi:MULTISPECIES: MarR family winged helix-turn-helix transcriptional regulator [unclassified Candidatus Frackibacter]|uniref:MarR family winged helix-turn-helix transcriptional regulator n=1 Tax=unclassified Candidatus Frackibacter TaxID=2648818 RepID=UPI000793539A|nr:MULTISPECIES: MarR family transcriptional regulator [unclassified Candidatus Frackibacter]KXS45120.1 MAG: transcriptional regulator [Candidatus Frackibacter sp. T328-2]SDC47301.1 DNA-binding transcriptional regulator, MarR family [Candidatus Frackibacter sp. WG11]SEM81353.1 DNA-binding transcriptional regulator, MarR family [Candidatus Frackibacter sp. WG12]SFL72681.1 DNA-binding transcriptional regulator, MarR family [Candidatus Frackibacter sp. WG13]